MDKIWHTPSGVRWVDATATPEQRARFMVTSYRRAIKKVYGVDWWHFSKGDITKSKWFKALVAAAQAMFDHAVAPEHWAEWRLRHMRSKGSKNAPPITVVMSAKIVSGIAGWFRKDCIMPVPMAVITQEHRVQFWRSSERWRRWRFHGDERAVWQAVPVWYYEMRRAEVYAGHEDPYTLFTSIIRKMYK